MKVNNIFEYTLGVILLTLHVVGWVLIITEGFTIINIIRVFLTFIIGTYDIIDSLEFKEEGKNEKT